MRILHPAAPCGGIKEFITLSFVYGVGRKKALCFETL